jgi:hypothetical protein
MYAIHKKEQVNFYLTGVGISILVHGLWKTRIIWTEREKIMK